MAELLEFVGLADKARQYPDQLSGGQKQRVGIARALATSPALLLADEATSALDPETTRDVLDLLRRINTELGVTIVVITHEMAVVAYLCHRVAVLEAGKVAELGDVYDVFSAPRSGTSPAGSSGPRCTTGPRPTSSRACASATPAASSRSSCTRRAGGRHPLTETFRAHDVDASVVYGGITEVGARPLGLADLRAGRRPGAGRRRPGRPAAVDRRPGVRRRTAGPWPRRVATAAGVGTAREDVR